MDRRFDDPRPSAPASLRNVAAAALVIAAYCEIHALIGSMLTFNAY